MDVKQYLGRTKFSEVRIFDKRANSENFFKKRKDLSKS